MGVNPEPERSERVGNSVDRFAKRLADAEARLGRDKGSVDITPGKEAAEDDFSAFGLALRVGTEMVAALGIGLAIGFGLDRLCNTKPLFLILFSMGGAAAGMLNVWRAVGKSGV